jgi:oxygen-independent coproporphyrinogen-3 oxidase
MGDILSGTPAGAEPPWRWPRAAYVHVPFCAYHCGYCDFAVVAGQDDRIDDYLAALSAELSTLGTPTLVQTLFLGGGTPTHLSPTQLERLVTQIARWLPLVTDSPEFTVEANPDTLTAEKVAVLADHGVTRISLGAQSFHPHLLRTLDRAHEPAEIPRAVEIARRRIAQVSLDLIFGVPGQTAEEWDADLHRALTLEPDHVSTYGLTYEKGTPLWKLRRQGKLVPLNEDAELALYTTAIDTLGAAGLEHYEISNFARPGKRCRHNETYWANEAYFGFGVGAARYVRGRREVNTRDLNAYLRKARAGEQCAFQSEELDSAERAKETMAVQLRRCDGIDRIAFRTQTGYELGAVAGPTLVRLIEQGYLNDDASRVCLTRQGKYVADAIIERLLRSR